MSQTITVSSRGSVRATFVRRLQRGHPRADHQRTAGRPQRHFCRGIPYLGRGPDLDRGHVLDGHRRVRAQLGAPGRRCSAARSCCTLGAALSVVGSVLAALAPTTEMMIFAQAVGGIGAGILFPISLSMIAAITPDHRARARVIATWAGFLSLGAVISPVLAGLTAQLFTVPGAAPGAPNVFSGWRVAYLVAAAVAVARSHRRAPGEGLRGRRGTQTRPARPVHPRARTHRRAFRDRSGGRCRASAPRMSS